MEPRSPALQADSLPAEPQGKPKNTGTGSLSLLQGIFPTQEWIRGLLHCRQILYQLSYEGSPWTRQTGAKTLWGSHPETIGLESCCFLLSGPWPNQWGHFMSNVWLTFSSGNFKSSHPPAFCDDKFQMYRKVERIVQGTPTWNHHRDSAVVNNTLVYLSSSSLSQFTSYLQAPLHFSPKYYACVSLTRSSISGFLIFFYFLIFFILLLFSLTYNEMNKS